MPRVRSSRASAAKAKSLFKKLASNEEAPDDDEDEIMPVAKRLKTEKRGRGQQNRRKDDTDRDFDLSQHQETSDDDEDEVAVDATIEFDEIDPDVCQSEETNEPAVVDYNENTKRYKKLLEIWSDFVEIQTAELREVPEHLKKEWNSKNKKSRVKVHCPLEGCKKPFTSALGLVYHYKRCGLSDCSETFKCKICGDFKDTSQKMILVHMYKEHLNQVPAAPEQLTEGLVRLKRTQVRKSDRRSVHPMIKGKSDMVSTYDYRGSLEMCGAFPDYMPLKSEWQPLSGSQSHVFHPQSSRSAKCRPHGLLNWRTMNKFEGSRDGCNRSFFTGGVVFSAAWVPTPLSCSKDQDQILAINVGLNFEDSHAYSEPDAECSLIEFWSFGKLGLTLKDSDDVNPQLLFCIAIVDGIVWDMEWCPLGNSWQPPDSTVINKCFPRLGLLSVACGNGIIKIFSVPHLDFIETSSRTALIYMPTPVIVLDPPGIGPLTNYVTSICKSISWSRLDGCKLIAAGFGSGIISVWNIGNKSRFLVSKDSNEKCQIFLPYWSFQTHGSAVNSVRWCPYEGSMILASGSSLDRELLFWDFTDSAHLPRRMNAKKGIVNCIEWPFRWPGIFIGQDDGLSLSSSFHYFYNPLANSKDSHRTTVNYHRSSVTCVSYNEWCNAQASADESGELVMFRNIEPLKDRNRGKFEHRIPIYHIERKLLNPMPQSQQEPCSVCYSYEETIKNFGLEFHDIDLSDGEKMKKSELARIKSAEKMGWEHPSNYPLLSINRIAWNPNKDSCTWIFSGGQSGICRITCVSMLKP